MQMALFHILWQSSIPLCVGICIYIYIYTHMYICCWSIMKCPTFCDLADCSIPGSSILHYHSDLAEIHVHWVSDAISNYLTLCYHLLLLPSIFLSIGVFSNDSALCIKLPMYLNSSFSNSPFNEYSGLIQGWYWMVYLWNEPISFCHFWDCTQILHFIVFCWLWGIFCYF